MTIGLLPLSQAKKGVLGGTQHALEVQAGNMGTWVHGSNPCCAALGFSLGSSSSSEGLLERPCRNQLRANHCQRRPLGVQHYAGIVHMTPAWLAAAVPLPVHRQAALLD
jgi:hypothetical protein